VHRTGELFFSDDNAVNALRKIDDFYIETLISGQGHSNRYRGRHIYTCGTAKNVAKRADELEIYHWAIGEEGRDVRTSMTKEAHASRGRKRRLMDPGSSSVDLRDAGFSLLLTGGRLGQHRGRSAVYICPQRHSFTTRMRIERHFDAVQLTRTSVATPSIWNSQPANVRLCHSLFFQASFKTSLLIVSSSPPVLPPSASVFSDSMALYKCFIIIIIIIIIIIFMPTTGRYSSTSLSY